ncbi:type I-F CRISPR-associated protein Csy3 [Halomonas sp.]|uniref:type I-F CRISPR-associated protein Csy3 n=1 Tax=Halomonas sp. TaxID=1486246 RepID=UPI0035648B9E
MAKKTVTQELTNFAVRRSLNPTPAIMHSLAGFDVPLMKGAGEQPVKVQRTTVLGTQGQYGLKVKDGKNAVSTNNIQEVDVAFLEPDHSVLAVSFGLKVHRLSGKVGANIEMCNIPEVEERIRAMNDAYAAAGGFGCLARLYAERIASGAWLWRNRFGANLVVKVAAAVDGQDAGDFTFTETSRDVEALAKVMEIGLTGGGLVGLAVSGLVEIGQGQEVFPSQEMASNTDVSRAYYANEKGDAMMHSQKIGNAIRTIDIWHDAVNEVGALPVEPYGSSIKHQEAFRYARRSFYTLLKQVLVGEGPLLKVREASSLADLDAIEDGHYFFAMLIRGGVFGMKD